MFQMLSSQRGFTGLEVVLMVVVTALLIGGGVYVVDHRNQQQESAETASAGAPSKQSSSTTTVSKSDKEQIIEAIKAYAVKKGGSNEGVDFEVDLISGNLAKGHSGSQYGGASFYAKKLNGSWEIIFEGQQLPGRTIGEKYDLPTDWYDTSYE